MKHWTLARRMGPAVSLSTKLPVRALAGPQAALTDGFHIFDFTFIMLTSLDVFILRQFSSLSKTTAMRYRYCCTVAHREPRYYQHLRHPTSLLFLIPLILLLLLQYLFRLLHPRLLGSPPSPPRLPIIGHLHLLTAVPHQSLYRLSLRLGPIFSLCLGSVPCIVASSAAAAREFLKVHDTSFSNRPITKAVSILTYGSSNFSFAPYGDFWRFTKRLYMLELFSNRTLDQFRPIRQDELRQLLEELHARAKEGAAVDVGAAMTRMTNNVTSRMAVSRRCSGTDGEAEEARRLVMETTELLGKFNLSDYVWFCKNLDLQGYAKRLKDLHKRFDGLIERIMNDKEENRRRKKMENNEEVLKEKDLLDILMDISEDRCAEDIFTGGTDNTSLTVQWAMAELINNPLSMEKAKAELFKVVGNGRVVDETDVPKLPYLKSIVMETLRLHPPTPLIPRESHEDCKVDGFNIPAKTRLFINVWAIGRDPKHWPSSDKFMPERFLSDEVDNGGVGVDIRGQHFQLIPFGSGRRGCPALTAALLVVHSALAALIQCFEWKVAGGGDEVDMNEAPGLTLQRATPLLCVPVVRSDGPLYDRAPSAEVL
ncbi:Cytochrome P450 93A2 [Platanthera guangdongensis]|uniref:Cytochrome P450 93A2 n=1 Tax=Platanthera guangdongensis TaxID=2320717 RepID=A0ABR2MM86_9ASPA